MYIKPTCTYSYVLSQSNHPSFIFKNIPKSIFFRIRRICSYLSDYLHFAHIFSLEFIKKGYDRDIVYKTSRMISDLDRDKILPYKNKQNKADFFEKLFFKLPFNFNYLNLDKFFYNYNKDSDYFSSFFNNYNLKLIYSMNSNLSKLLTHNFQKDKPISYKFSFCTKISCNYCPYANSKSYIKLNKFFLPIMCNSNCRALNLIYIIYCKTCLCYYIGQTNNFRNRFSAHKRNILINKTMINSDINDGVNLIEHFNQKDHDLRKNFGFFIFKTGIPDLNDRLNLENQLIHLFLTLKIPILNDRVADKYLYKKQIFLFN